MVSMTEGFTPILLLGCAVAAWVLLRQKRLALFVFVTGEVLVNTCFFLLDPWPPRHYLLMTPAVAISAGILIARSLQAFEPEPGTGKTVLGAAAISSLVVLASLSLNGGPGHFSYFRSEFLDQQTMKRQIAEASAVADKLIHLPKLGTPVIVLCDSNLVLAQMEKRAAGLSATFRTVDAGESHVGVHDVTEGYNRFIMIEQGWEPNTIKALDNSSQYAGLPVLTSAGAGVEYLGPRRRILVQP
jgi:hypothetical protein